MNNDFAITLYVGDVGEYLSDLAKANNKNATLIDSYNTNCLSAGTYYTSIGDLSKLSDFCKILKKADVVIYAKPDRWSDEKNGISQMQYWTEFFLTNFYLTKQKKIVNFNLPALPLSWCNVFELVDSRKINDKQLWIAGCSISHGMGIEKHQTYGQLIADKLDLPVSFLTKPGSSLIWAADQILRSDIRKDDLVVWGLTSMQRFPYVQNKKLRHILSNSFVLDKNLKSEIDINRLDHDELIYRSISDVFKVINYCKKIGAQLILANLLDLTLPLYLHEQDCFIMLYGLDGTDVHDRFLDLGSDNEHPGVITHAWYAEEILKKIHL